MRLLLALAFTVTLSACTFSKAVYLPDGSQGHSIRCGGTLNSFAGCLDKAGELCAGSGYDILDARGEVIPYETAQLQSNSNSSVFGNKDNIFASGSSNTSASYNKSAIVNRNIFVRCK